MPVTRCRFDRIDTAPVVSLTAASSEALTFQRRNSLRVSIGLALCGTRKMRRTPTRACGATCSPTTAWPSVTAKECPQAPCLTRWKLRCLPRLRRSTVSGQLLVSFCSCQHPRSGQAVPGHHCVAPSLLLSTLQFSQLRLRSCSHSLLGSFRLKRLGGGSSHVPYLEPFVQNSSSSLALDHLQRVERHRHLGLALGCWHFLRLVGLLDLELVKALDHCSCRSAMYATNVVSTFVGAPSASSTNAADTCMYGAASPCPRPRFLTSSMYCFQRFGRKLEVCAHPSRACACLVVLHAQLLQ